MQPRSAAFPRSEHLERFKRAREALRLAKLDACLMVAPENVYYFGGYETWVGVNSPQFLIFTAREDEPSIVLRNVDVPLARETSWVPDVRSYHLHTDDVASAVREVLAEKGVAVDKIRVDLQPARRAEMMQKSGRRTVPQIWIGERHVGGCDDLYALEREGRLDPLLKAIA